MKRICSFLTVLAMIVTILVPFPIDLPFDFALPASAASSGTTGNCTWTLNNGTLTISGNGAMENYTASSTLPWGKYIIKAIIEEGVTGIGDYAFFRCARLTSVCVQNSVTSIGKYAFEECTGLTSVTIGNGVTSIGSYAFEDCTELTAVYITDFAAWCEIDFSDSSSNPLCYAGKLYLNNELLILSGDLEIPNGVTSIGSYAFYSCTRLTSITIPDSVTSIGKYAFEGCAGLTSVHITNLAAWCNIEFGNGISNPLYYAKSLYLDDELVTDLVIPDSVTSIGKYAFEDCDGLTGVYITDMVAWCNINFGNSISNPLYYAEKLYLNGNLVTKLGIPRGVTEIKNYAFYNCGNITSVTIPSSVTSIGAGVFRGCTGLTSITIPDSVTTIGDSAFYNCTGLTSVTIGNGVTSIGDGAFYSCTGLTSITIPDSVTSIGDYAFYGCTRLTSVTIGNSVTSIGDEAFCGCTGLTSVTIPYTVNTIDSRAFNSNVTLNVHPNSVGYTYALKNGNPYVLTEHTPAGEDVIVPATCTAEGSITNHCTVCDRDYTKVLPMVDHALEEPVIVPATCAAAGSKTEHCTSCGQDFVTVLPELVHVIENNVCTLCGCPDIQSDHPYADNLDQTWTHTVPDATSVTVTFSEETYVEAYIDYITLYDGEDNEINYYTGTELAGKTVTIPGDTVKIRLETDSSGNGYGFAVSAITAELPEAPEIPTYNGIELSTAGAIQLLRYIDHRDGLTSEQADINGDGKVTVFDAVRFLQILNFTPIE